MKNTTAENALLERNMTAPQPQLLAGSGDGTPVGVPVGKDILTHCQIQKAVQKAVPGTVY